MQAEFISLAIFGAQHFKVEAPQHLAFAPAGESFHGRVEVNDAQRRIYRQDALCALLEDGRQPSLFLDQGLRFQGRTQTCCEMRYK